MRKAGLLKKACAEWEFPILFMVASVFTSAKRSKIIVAYLRMIVNPRDEEALKRIINYPARGIGKTTIDKAILFANENNISMWEVLENAGQLWFQGRHTCRRLKNL